MSGRLAYLPLFPKNGFGSATQFLIVLPYVDECFANDVLNPVDPRVEFPVVEHGHGDVVDTEVVVCGQEQGS